MTDTAAPPSSALPSSLPSSLPRPAEEFPRLEKAWVTPKGWRFITTVNKTNIATIIKTINTAIISTIITTIIATNFRTFNSTI